MAVQTRADQKNNKKAKPGTKGKGDYYRIEVRPKEEFTTFRYHDVGEKNGDLKRLAGKRPDGSWDTQAWLINKNSAHLEGEKLVADSTDVKELLGKLGSEPMHEKGDIFRVAA